MHNYGSLSLRSFAQAALGFLATVRDGHPTVPLLVLSPVHGSGWREDGSCSALIVAPDREAVDPRYPTLSQMRAELERVVGLLQRRGMPRAAHANVLPARHVGERLAGAIGAEQVLVAVDQQHVIHL